MLLRLGVRSVLCVLFVGGIFVGCGKKKSDDSSAPDTTAADTQTDVLLIGAALSSAGSNSGVKTSAGLALAQTFKTYDSDCDPQKSGWPTNFGAEVGGSGGSAAYNAAFMSCLLKEPDNGGDTIMGAFANAAGMMCALGDQLVFDGQQHTITSFKITTDCFPAAYVSMLATNNITVSSTATVTASETDFLANTSGQWTASIRVQPSLTYQGKSLNMDTVYLISDQPGVFSMAKADGPSVDTTLSSPYDRAWVVQMDKTNGYLKYEGWMEEYPLTSPPMGATNKNRHSRVVIKGTLGSDGSFTSLNSVQVLYSNIWKGQGTAGADLAAFKTMKGDPTNGYTLLTYESNSGTDGAIASYTNAISACIDKTGTVNTGACSGNAGITMTADADTAFGILPTTTTTAKSWWVNLVPPAFTSVTTAEVQTK